MKLTSTVTGALGTGALGTAGLLLAGLAAAGPASAAVASCEVRVTSIRAVEVQEDDQNEDEVFLRLGNTSTPQHTYFEGQLRNTLGEPGEIFSGTLRTRLVEKDLGSATVIDNATLACRTHTRTVTYDDASGDTVYTVIYTVAVL
jgi:hypothetical protein